MTKSLKVLGQRVLYSHSKFRPYIDVGVMEKRGSFTRFNPTDADPYPWCVTATDAREYARQHFDLGHHQIRVERRNAA